MADTAREVMLSAANEKKIGVVFAQATLAPLARSVRTVGLVTYDETRVETIAPLVDGLGGSAVRELYRPGSAAR